MFKSHLLLICLFTCTFAYLKNNVCRTFFDYHIKPVSKNCWHDPAYNKDMPELVTQYNYELESYEVVTSDGYILTVFRLPNRNSKKGVVYLQHPLFASSSVWVDKGNSSLAYLLYHEGYDVWMGNFRGNFYSRKHLYLDPNTNQFWNFSFHEKGSIDIPAQIDLIIDKTKANKIAFVGHSMAGTAAIIYASLLPDHAEKNINVFVLFTPAIYFTHATTPILLLAPFSNIIYKIAESLNLLEGFQHNTFWRTILLFCNSFPPGIKICALAAQFIAGINTPGIDPAIFPIMFSQNPAGLSLKCLSHYAQIKNSKNFRFYDYGELNKEYYNSNQPPNYPVQNIRSALYIVAGEHDTFVAAKDLFRLYNNLQKQTQAKTTIAFTEGLNHIDFSYSKNMKRIVYDPIIKLFNEKNFVGNFDIYY